MVIDGADGERMTIAWPSWIRRLPWNTELRISTTTSILRCELFYPLPLGRRSEQAGQRSSRARATESLVDKIFPGPSLLEIVRPGTLPYPITQMYKRANTLSQVGHTRDNRTVTRGHYPPPPAAIVGARFLQSLTQRFHHCERLRLELRRP